MPSPGTPLMEVVQTAYEAGLIQGRTMATEHFTQQLSEITDEITNQLKGEQA